MTRAVWPGLLRLAAGARYVADSERLPDVTAHWLYAGVKQETMEMVRVGAGGVMERSGRGVGVCRHQRHECRPARGRGKASTSAICLLTVAGPRPIFKELLEYLRRTYDDYSTAVQERDL